VPNEGKDLCDTIYYLFTHSYPSSGEVIDARGISGSALTCTKGSPWSESGNSVTAPSTILLPPGIVVMDTTWVLPSNTHLIGEGDNDPLSGTPGTWIQASSSTSGTMIQFAPASGASGISVERLTLDGKGMTISGTVFLEWSGAAVRAGSDA
jgi:hypothetical protein